MNIEVTSVSRKEQKLSRTPSAVFVITPEDIRQSGATNIPDVLRMVPGMDVAQINSSTWAITARGWNAEFSNELLVLVDGRNVYTPTFGGVFWGTLDLPLENIERIEVIRGPGGSVWGENAVNGVVNIIQKKASDTRGGMVVAGGGNTEQGLGTAQYGGSLGQRMDYRVYSKYFNRDAMAGDGGQSGDDGWHLLRGGFRSDTTFSSKDSLTVQGDVYAGREGDPTKVLPSIAFAGPVNTQLFVNVTGGDLLGDKRKTFAFDFHQHRALGQRHDLVWGFGYRRTAEDSDGTFDVSLDPPKQSLSVFSGFVQYEVALIPDRLYLTAGCRCPCYLPPFQALPPSSKPSPPAPPSMLGPVIAAGPLMAALAAMGVGGTVGGLSGALVGLGTPEDEAKRYEGRMQKGGILLSVHCDTSDEIRRAKELLKTTGAEDISSAGEASVDAATAQKRAATP
jgi:iron complex outermembrane receptor protein